MATAKARVLIVGMGGVGTMAAYALEAGSLANVTAVLRSDYSIVKERGFEIDSIEWGRDIKGWRPTTSKLTHLALMCNTCVTDMLTRHQPVTPSLM